MLGLEVLRNSLTMILSLASVSTPAAFKLSPSVCAKNPVDNMTFSTSSLSPLFVSTRILSDILDTFDVRELE